MPQNHAESSHHERRRNKGAGCLIAVRELRHPVAVKEHRRDKKPQCSTFMAQSPKAEKTHQDDWQKQATERNGGKKHSGAWLGVAKP